MKICSVADCSYPSRAKGLCSLHYNRMRTTGRLTGRQLKDPSTLFWKQVHKTDDCWIWIGKDQTTNGYGRFAYRAGKHDQRRKMAHRWAWEELRGPLPDNMTVDHLCRNTLCVRPDHMQVITLRDNILRSDNPMALNARKTHCPQGHEYDEANTYLNPKSQRICKACSRTNALEAYHAKRQAQGFPRQLPAALRTHCPQGHEYTPDNTYSHAGRRFCKTCIKARSRAHYLKQRKSSA